MRCDTDTGLDLHLTLVGPDQTDALGAALATQLRASDTLLLSGPIGAGKSHLARAVIRSLMRRHDLPPEDIPSPTYTLVQSYSLGDIEVWHADLYRLTGVEEIHELGLDAAFDDAICLVEWPDRLGNGTPASALRIALSLGGDAGARQARLTATAQRWSPLARHLAPFRTTP